MSFGVRLSQTTMMTKCWFIFYLSRIAEILDGKLISGKNFYLCPIKLLRGTVHIVKVSLDYTHLGKNLKRKVEIKSQHENERIDAQEQNKTLF